MMLQWLRLIEEEILCKALVNDVILIVSLILPVALKAAGELDGWKRFPT